MGEQESPTYENLLATLKTFPSPLLPPGHSYHANLTAQIAGLQLHPTLEAALHILNHDLPSAHFLVRHMQSTPAVEGMLLHGILHRIEGDYDNARAWYSDVAGDAGGVKLLRRAWQGGKEEVLRFVDRVEGLKKRREGDEKVLGETSGKEIMAVLEWCEEKFGTGKWEDASSAWAQSEKLRVKGQQMTTGSEGFRTF
jgi:hypothetical protein